MPSPAPPDRSAGAAGTGFARSAARWALAGELARSRRVDRALRSGLPGLTSAATVVPLAVAGLLVSELPLQALALQSASVARHLRRGALSDPRGRAALAASAVTGARLVAAHRDARRTREVLDHALTDALGAELLAALPADQQPPDVPLTRRQVLLPRVQRRRYLAAADLAYGDAGRHNHLDIWRRADLPRDGQAPVLVQVHGSAWVTLSKRGQAYPLLAHMAERGWVCVSINYSLSPKARWPAHIVDVKRALAWVRREIGAYGGDPGFVALTGGSAGGHLSALAALSAGHPGFQPGFEDVDTSVAAAVPLYGVYDFLDRAGDAPAEQERFLERIVIGQRRADAPEVWDRGSPLSWVGPHAPPFFVLHGAIDTVTNPDQAEAFATALRAASTQPVAFARLPGAQHCFDVLPSVRTHHTVCAIDRFLTTVHARTQATPPGAATPRG